MIKKGPKGILDLLLTLPINNNGNNTTVPNTVAKKTIKTTCIADPASIPSGKAIFTSPPPIHLALETIKIMKNKMKNNTPAKKACNIFDQLKACMLKSAAKTLDAIKSEPTISLGNNSHFKS